MSKIRTYMGNKLFTTWSLKKADSRSHISHYHYVEVDESVGIRIYDTSNGPQHSHRFAPNGTFEPDVDHSHDLTELLKQAMKEAKHDKLKIV